MGVLHESFVAAFENGVLEIEQHSTDLAERFLVVDLLGRTMVVTRRVSHAASLTSVLVFLRL
jgi:hypothetical protein